MGNYLETPERMNKAEQLEKLYGAKRIEKDIAEDLIDEQRGAVICVVKNPLFDAAAFCCSSQEFRRFNHPMDDRQKTWLFIEDRQRVCDDSGYTADMKAIAEME
jgi:hypothetical protein